MLADLWILAVSYVIAAVQTWHLTEVSSFASFISMRVKVLNVILSLGVLVFWHVIFLALGLYRSKRIGNRKQECRDVFIATSLATLVLGVAKCAFQLQIITPLFIAVFWAVAGSTIIGFRLTLRTVLRRLRTNGRNSRQMLIVGTNHAPRNLRVSSTIGPNWAIGLIGFADDSWTGSQECPIARELIVTDLSHFSIFLREHVVDEVVVALPMKSLYSQAARIVAECQQQGVIVRVLGSVFDLEQGVANSSESDLASVVTLTTRSFEGWPIVLKRLLDVLLSSIVLITLAPLLLVVLILIKLDSPGPALFVQERVGLNKRRFRMYKFRTMVVNAEQRQSDLEQLNEADGAVFKIRKDPRITRLGKYLRKTSIDELPQLLNVLKGDMTLVGPRPLPLRDYHKFDEDWLRRRFSVRPGITCLWQINGRSSVSFQEWMRLDMHYIDTWSLWLDLQILARTIPAVLRGSGAA